MSGQISEQATEQAKEYKAFHGSKRIVGAVCVSVGLVFLLSVGIAAIFKKLADPETAVQVGGYIFFAGCGLLGLTAVEDLRGIFGK
jgi:predicted permease